jgi:hydroxyacid-oxoacid transhydrogenase
LIAAGILGADVSRAKPEDAGKILSDRLVAIMQRLKVPNGLRAVGYRKSDIPALVQGTLPQARVTKLSPRPVVEADLAHLFEEALQGW